MENDILDRIDRLQASVDSIMCSTDAQKIFAQAELEADDLTAFWVAFIAMIAGIFAAIFSYLGYRYQKKTTLNTDKISMTVQKSLFRDIIRHLYRNMICTLAKKGNEITILLRADLQKNAANVKLTDITFHFIDGLSESERTNELFSYMSHYVQAEVLIDKL